MAKSKEAVIIGVLGALTALGPFSVDFYLPAFGFIAHDLNTSQPTISLTLSSFFTGMSIGTLLYGPLLDRYGRKPPLLAGLAFYALASLACAWSKSVEALIIFRFFQAIGTCAASVASATLVRDLFPANETSTVFSWTMLILGASPLFAPALGGLVSSALGWRYVFVILAVFAVLIAVAVSLCIPRVSASTTLHSLDLRKIFRVYTAIFINRQFRNSALCGAAAFAGLFTYISNSPFVFLELYRFTPGQFSLVFSFLACGLILLTQINRLLLKKSAPESLLRIALLFQIIVSAGSLVFVLQQNVSVIAVVAIFFLYQSALGMVFPNVTAICLSNATSDTGTASALLQTLQMLAAGLIIFMTSWLQSSSFLPVCFLFLLCSLSAYLFFYKSSLMEKPVPRKLKMKQMV
ncbi:MAG: multidrug effflux MFS transporter [Chitinophagaceae bacterium]|nr:multidrug effflux MFS transporter [Chitinophagaceae bacterium]